MVDGEMLLLALILIAMGFYMTRRKKLGRRARNHWREDLIGWGVLPKTEYSREANSLVLDRGFLLDEPNTTTPAIADEPGLALSWSRMINGSYPWCGMGLLGVCVLLALAPLAALIFFARPIGDTTQTAIAFTQADATYVATLFFLLTEGIFLGAYLGMALYLVKGAQPSNMRRDGTNVTEQTLDDYRSPHLRWLFVVYTLGYLAIVILLAPRDLFTMSSPGLWFILASVVIAGLAIWVMERLGPFALRWPRETLSADPTLAAHAGERARMFAVATLVCTQAMAVVFMTASGITAIFALPNALTRLDTSSPRFLVAAGIYATLGLGVTVIFSLERGRLGGRLTGWPRFGLVAVRDPWEMDDAAPL